MQWPRLPLPSPNTLLPAAVPTSGDQEISLGCYGHVHCTALPVPLHVQGLEGWRMLVDALAQHAPLQLGGVVNQVSQGGGGSAHARHGRGKLHGRITRLPHAACARMHVRHRSMKACVATEPARTSSFNHISSTLLTRSPRAPAAPAAPRRWWWRCWSACRSRGRCAAPRRE